MVLGETDDHHNIEITHDNHHIVSTREIQIAANSVHSDMTVVVSGTGCVLVQVGYLYTFIHSNAHPVMGCIERLIY